MEHQTWAELSVAIGQVDRHWREAKRYRHPTALIVRVYLWSVRHDRPICWAVDRRNWSGLTRPTQLPDQSTMSRRLRSKDFQQFLIRLGLRLGGSGPATRVQRIDGKALSVAAHSKDRDARWGRGAGQQSRGYRLVMLQADRPMPVQWVLTPLNIDERVVARRIARRLTGDFGYLLADAMFDDNLLHAIAAGRNYRVLAPRRRPGTSIGHVPQHPGRLRCIDQLEPPPHASDFGRLLHRQRHQIERDNGNLVSYGGGLTSGLPSWVRRIWRVRNWVHGKLLLNAARIRCRTRTCA